MSKENMIDNIENPKRKTRLTTNNATDIVTVPLAKYNWRRR